MVIGNFKLEEYYPYIRIRNWAKKNCLHCYYENGIFTYEIKENIIFFNIYILNNKVYLEFKKSVFQLLETIFELKESNISSLLKKIDDAYNLITSKKDEEIPKPTFKNIKENEEIEKDFRNK